MSSEETSTDSTSKPSRRGAIIAVTVGLIIVIGVVAVIATRGGSRTGTGTGTASTVTGTGTSTGTGAAAGGYRGCWSAADPPPGYNATLLVYDFTKMSLQAVKGSVKRLHPTAKQIAVSNAAYVYWSASTTITPTATWKTIADSASVCQVSMGALSSTFKSGCKNDSGITGCSPDAFTSAGTPGGITWTIYDIEDNPDYLGCFVALPNGEASLPSAWAQVTGTGPEGDTGFVWHETRETFDVMRKRVRTQHPTAKYVMLTAAGAVGNYLWWTVNLPAESATWKKIAGAPGACTVPRPTTGTPSGAVGGCKSDSGIAACAPGANWTALGYAGTTGISFTVYQL